MKGDKRILTYELIRILSIFPSYNTQSGMNIK